MRQMLEQLEETRSKGPIVVGDRWVPTLEHRHDGTVLPKRRNNTPSKGEIEEGKDGFLPPREVGLEERIRKPIQTDSGVHTMSQCVTQLR